MVRGHAVRTVATYPPILAFIMMVGTHPLPVVGGFYVSPPPIEVIEGGVDIASLPHSHNASHSHSHNTAHSTLLEYEPPQSTGYILPREIQQYEVRAGDTLSEIAEQHGIHINTLYWANDLNVRSTIHQGDTLTILPMDGVLHEIIVGETLLSIAYMYDTDINKIQRTNNIKDIEHLIAGHKLIIPDAEPVAKTTTYSTRPNYVRVNSSYFARPTDGYISQGMHYNNAIDVANVCGTPIRASVAGRVSVAVGNGKYNQGYGNYIMINHNNNIQTLYAHLSKVFVSPGQVVQKSQVIGEMGTTGYSTGCHLHFEVRGARNPLHA